MLKDGFCFWHHIRVDAGTDRLCDMLGEELAIHPGSHSITETRMLQFQDDDVLFTNQE
jgi:hypothetical protein